MSYQFMINQMFTYDAIRWGWREIVYILEYIITFIFMYYNLTIDYIIKSRLIGIHLRFKIEIQEITFFLFVFVFEVKLLYLRWE